MPSSELAHTQAPLETVAGHTALMLRSPLLEGSAQPRVGRSRAPAAVHAIAMWVRRVLAESARAWALAAGVPPHAY